MRVARRVREGARGRRPAANTGTAPAGLPHHLLSDPDARFYDLGSDFYTTRVGPERRKRNHIRQLESLGYTVTLEPAA